LQITYSSTPDAFLAARLLQAPSCAAIIYHVNKLVSSLTLVYVPNYGTYIYMMRIDGAKLNNLCRKKRTTVTECLRRAGVSRNAYYSLLRKNSILPRSIESISLALRISPQDIMAFEKPAVARAREWADTTNLIKSRHPEVDPDNIRHTLILLDMPPVERLRRALLRGKKI